MKTILLKLILLFSAALLVGCQTAPAPQAVKQAPAPTAHDHQETATKRKRPLPAFFKDAGSIPNPLPPTLAPEKFGSEQVRAAYRVAKEIPATLAQLPCFCYCDESVGHQSLHSCYEDDHSAGCGTCVDEALMAYQLQKEQGLTPAQVREIIINKFSH